MESNITTILIKKFWKRCETFPLNGLQRCKTLHFGCPLSLTTLPSEVPALFPPPPPLTPRKDVPYLKRNQSDFCQDVIVYCDIKIVYNYSEVYRNELGFLFLCQSQRMSTWPVTRTSLLWMHLVTNLKKLVSYERLDLKFNQFLVLEMRN